MIIMDRVATTNIKQPHGNYQWKAKRRYVCLHLKIHIYGTNDKGTVIHSVSLWLLFSNKPVIHPLNESKNRLVVDTTFQTLRIQLSVFEYLHKAL